jgi:hypothetical protein
MKTIHDEIMLAQPMRCAAPVCVVCNLCFVTVKLLAIGRLGIGCTIPTRGPTRFSSTGQEIILILIIFIILILRRRNTILFSFI